MVEPKYNSKLLADNLLRYLDDRLKDLYENPLKEDLGGAIEEVRNIKAYLEQWLYDTDPNKGCL